MSQQPLSIGYRQKKIYDFFAERIISKMTDDVDLLSYLKRTLVSHIMTYDENSLPVDIDDGSDDYEAVFTDLCMCITVYPSFYDNGVFSGISNRQIEQEEEELIRDFSKLYI